MAGRYDTGATIATLLRERALNDPGAPFLTLGEDDPLRRGEILSAATALAGRLQALGVSRGDTVATYMGSRRELVECWFGCILLGAVFMPLNIALRGTFLEHQLRTSGARLLFADQDRLPQLLAVLGPSDRLDVVALDGYSSTIDLDGHSEVRIQDGGQFAALSPEPIREDQAGRWNEPALILFTSGTTGPSKAVVLSHRYVTHMAEAYATSLEMGPGDVFYGPLPMHHLSGTIVAPMVPLVAGASSVMDPVFSASRFWSRVHQVGATHTVLVGGMPQMLWQRTPDELEQDNPIRAAVVIPVSAEIHHAFERRFGLTILGGYGSSEAGQITFSSVADPPVPGTAGRPTDAHEVKVVDDHDQELPPGVVGEIVVRPRVPHVMFEEYRGNPEAMVAATRNLWFHTGDLGVFDPDGNLSFADRKKDYLRRRGENISSFEVENALAAHPAVLEVAVVGVPSELGEDEVKAYVVLRDGAAINEVALLHHAATVMPYFAVPRYISFVPSLPRSAVGRIQKFTLRDGHATDPGWDRDRAGYRLTRHNIDEFVSDPQGFTRSTPSSNG